MASFHFQSPEPHLDCFSSNHRDRVSAHIEQRWIAGERSWELICITLYTSRLLEHSSRASMFIHAITCFFLKIICQIIRTTISQSDLSNPLDTVNTGIFSCSFLHHGLHLSLLEFTVFHSQLLSMFLCYYSSTTPASLWLHLSGNNLKLLFCEVRQ